MTTTSSLTDSVTASTAELHSEESVKGDLAVLSLGQEYLVQGQVNRAEAILSAIDLGSSGGHPDKKQFALLSTLGEVYRKQGKLHLAAAFYHPLLDLVEGQPLEPPLFHFHYELSRLYHEWNWLEKEQQFLQWCLHTVEHNNLQRTWSLEGYLELAWNLWAAGRAQAAKEALQAARAIAQRSGNANSYKQVNAHQARLWLRLGDLKAAIYQIGRSGLGPEAPILYARQFEYLTLVRVLIIQGRTDQALSLLERLDLAVLDDGRNSDAIEILVLQALAYQAQGDIANALAALANALCRGEREGFFRTFVDEGAPMAQLLQKSAAQGVTLVYVHDLLQAFDRVHLDLMADPPQNNDALVEPLSRRELEVLRLAASGCPNEDIARRLYISLATVKKHLSNILGKLGAKNRTQAAARARELHLIE